MISEAAFWKGRDTEYAEELTDEIRRNAEVTLAKVNELLERSGFKSIDSLNSGWRPRAVNEATSNAATGSKHLTGQAADIPDSGHVLASWCVDNLDVMEEIGLWMEDPRYTPTWFHVQTVPPKSGRRVFIPRLGPPVDDSIPVTWA